MFVACNCETLDPGLQECAACWPRKTSVLRCQFTLQVYEGATADKRTTSQKSWDKAQVRLRCSLHQCVWDGTVESCVPIIAVPFDRCMRACVCHDVCSAVPQTNMAVLGISLSLTMCSVPVQDLRTSINKSILQAERQIESSYVSAKAAAQKKWADAHAEL